MRKQNLGKRAVVTAMVLSMAATLLTGCGGSSYSTTMDNSSASATADSIAPMENYGVYEEAAPEVAGSADKGSSEAGEVTEEAAQTTSRKLITNMNISTETEDFDVTMTTIENRVAELGGYIENSELWNGSYYSDYSNTRSASLAIRVPAEHLTELIATVSQKSNITSQSKSVQDVTLTYVDLESHRNALQAEEARLLELMSQAETMEDLITIEDKLADVRYQLESMESQLRTYDNQISYSTVYLDIQEVERTTPAPQQTTWGRISSGFSENLYSVGKGIQNFFIELIIGLPYIVVWLVVLAVIILIIWTICRVSHNRNEQRRNRNRTVTGGQGAYPGNAYPPNTNIHTQEHGEKNDSTKL